MDGLLVALSRCQAKTRCPLLTAGMSVLFYSASIPGWLWSCISLWSKGITMSKTWTEGFVEMASARQRPPNMDMLAGVGIATFDNLTVQSDYSGFETSDRDGVRLDMTT